MLYNRLLPATWEIYNDSSFIKKKGKADYLILKNYRLIALENTFSKILKRVIVDRIVNIAKKKIYYYKAK